MPAMTTPPTSLLGDVPEIAKLAEEHGRLSRERAAARSNLRRAEVAVKSASLRDEQDLAQAVREGKAHPGPAHFEKATRELAEARRLAKATDTALEAVEDDIRQAVAQHGDAWISKIDGRLGEARAAYAQAVEDLAAARAAVDRLQSVKLWAAAERDAYVTRTPPVPLASPAGPSSPWAAVVDALRADAANGEITDHERTIRLPAPQFVKQNR